LALIRKQLARAFFFLVDAFYSELPYQFFFTNSCFLVQVQLHKRKIVFDCFRYFDIVDSAVFSRASAAGNVICETSKNGKL